MGVEVLSEEGSTMHHAEGGRYEKGAGHEAAASGDPEVIAGEAGLAEDAASGEEVDKRQAQQQVAMVKRLRKLEVKRDWRGVLAEMVSFCAKSSKHA